MKLWLCVCGGEGGGKWMRLLRTSIYAMPYAVVNYIVWLPCAK